MNGLLIIDKPEGMTSADVVRVVKQRLRCKTGHLGTLDPFASGVLPLCVGEGTKIAQFLSSADKAYTGIIRLGTRTDTGDPTGEVIGTAAVPVLTAALLASVAERFRGAQQQVPPMYSALKRQGTPLYKLARRGIAVERSPRPVHIEALTLTLHSSDAIAVALSCSKGTYVRVLAEDIAAALGTVGHLATLRRTRFGRFRLEDAVPLARLDDEAPRLIGLREALGDVREICLDGANTRRAQQGYAPLLTSLQRGACHETAKLVGPEGELAAVIETDDSGQWRFARVFAPEPRAAV